MCIKAFKDILHNECANCAKNFGDDFSRNEIETSTSLVFSNCGFISPPEDISNFQAVCYIYGIPPPVLESSIKKHLTSVMTARNPSFKESRILSSNDKENDTDDPLDSISLSLCQNCSITLAELYTVFYKYEKLSNDTSVITKGVKYSKETLGLQDIKLECTQEDTDIFEDGSNSSHAFNDFGDENSRNVQEEEEEPVELDSIKVEEELNPESDHSFNELNANSGGEENAEELRDFSQNVEGNENTYDRGVRRSTRCTRNRKRINESSESWTENDEDDAEDVEDTEDLYTAVADKSPTSEDDDWSVSDVDDKRNTRTNEAKKKAIPLQRRSKSKRYKTDKNDSESTSTSKDLEEQTIQRFIRKVPGLYSIRCIACKIYFTNILAFKRHNQIQHKIIWKDNDTLEKWMNICATKSYNCDICDEFYISREELNYHLITHIANRDTITEFNEGIQGPPFRCPKCENSEKLYENWARLRLHGYKIHRVAFTNQIVETPAPERRRFLETYFCKECDNAPFTIRNAWITHMKHFHSLSGCCLCGHTFSNEQMLHSHIKNEHDLEKARSQDYHCKNCDEKFQSLQSLWIHALFHIIEGEHIESQTFEEFRTELTGSTEIQCKIEKDNKSALINDSTAKSDNINIFPCLRCKKGFKSFYALIIHQFAQASSDLDTLKRENVCDRDFHCPVCAIDCKRNIILRQHCLSTHHMLVSTKAYSAEEFLKELLIEKDHCNKNRVISAKLVCPYKQVMACKKCCKIFNSFYALKIHELGYKLDIPTLEKITLKSTGLICPKCNVSFNNTSQRLSRIKCHCLEKHDVIVAVSPSELKKYTQQLIFEKDYCMKNQITEDSNEDNSQSNIEVEGQSNTTEWTIKDDEEIKNKVKTLTASNSQSVCYRCGADCGTYYIKKLHEMSHKLDIPLLEKEILKKGNYTCPRCGMDFEGKSLYRLKLHCLEEHNLMLGKNAEEFQSFNKQLSEAKEYCNKNKNTKSQQSINSVSVAEREISQYTELKKLCSLCDKVCSSYIAKRIHELAHKIDLKTLPVEDVAGTAIYTCPRCAKVFYSNIEIRLHCLEYHNIIASTKSYPGYKFIEFLTNEQESIKKYQQKGAAVLPPDKGERQVKTGNPQQSTSGSECFSKEDKIGKTDCISTDSVERNRDDRANVDQAGETESEKFVCDTCGKVVATKHALNAHKMSHRPEKHFVCERCGASFKTANLFRFHKRVHFEKDNGIRPTCNICGKSYISSHGLNKHKTDYHPKKKLSCPICHKTFASQSYTRTHIAKHEQN